MRFTLDEWMIRLYPGLKFDHDDYAERAVVVRDLTWEHGVGATVALHWLSTVPDEAARRLKQRSDERGTYAHDVTADENTHLAALMEEPTEDEGLTIVRV